MATRRGIRDVVQGEERDFNITLTTLDSSTGLQDRFNLTGVVEASSFVCFLVDKIKVTKAFDGPDVQILDLAKGEIKATLRVADTQSFVEDEIGDLEVLVDRGALGIRRIQKKKVFRVAKQFC